MKCTVLPLGFGRGGVREAPLNLGCGVCGGFGVFFTAIKYLNHEHMVHPGEFTQRYGMPVAKITAFLEGWLVLGPHGGPPFPAALQMPCST